MTEHPSAEGAQDEALRLANAIEGLATKAWTREEVAAELRRLHAENTTLQQGYDAARLEIEALRMRSAAPAVERAHGIGTEKENGNADQA